MYTGQLAYLNANLLPSVVLPCTAAPFSKLAFSGYLKLVGKWPDLPFSAFLRLLHYFTHSLLPMFCAAFCSSALLMYSCSPHSIYVFQFSVPFLWRHINVLIYHLSVTLKSFVFALKHVASFISLVCRLP